MKRIRIVLYNGEDKSRHHLFTKLQIKKELNKIHKLSSLKNKGQLVQRIYNQQPLFVISDVKHKKLHNLIKKK